MQVQVRREHYLSNGSRCFFIINATNVPGGQHDKLLVAHYRVAKQRLHSLITLLLHICTSLYHSQTSTVNMAENKQEHIVYLTADTTEGVWPHACVHLTGHVHPHHDINAICCWS